MGSEDFSRVLDAVLAGGLVASDISLPATWVIGGGIHLLAALSFLPVLMKWPRDASPKPTTKKEANA
jgi:hypothetical protein